MARVHVLSRHVMAGGTEAERSAGGITDARFARVVEFMSAHFAEPLTLERLAAEACISRFHFARLFRRRLGQSPYRFLAELRLNAARRMLLATNRTVGEVAMACGFASASNFSAAFSRRFGMPPRLVRAGCRPIGA